MNQSPLNHNFQKGLLTLNTLSSILERNIGSSTCYIDPSLQIWQKEHFDKIFDLVAEIAADAHTCSKKDAGNAIFAATRAVLVAAEIKILQDDEIESAEKIILRAREIVKVLLQKPSPKGERLNQKIYLQLAKINLMKKQPELALELVKACLESSSIELNLHYNRELRLGEKYPFDQQIEKWAKYHLVILTWFLHLSLILDDLERANESYTQLIWVLKSFFSKSSQIYKIYYPFLETFADRTALWLSEKKEFESYISFIFEKEVQSENTFNQNRVSAPLFTLSSLGKLDTTYFQQKNKIKPGATALIKAVSRNQSFRSQSEKKGSISATTMTFNNSNRRMSRRTEKSKTFLSAMSRSVVEATIKPKSFRKKTSRAAKSKNLAEAVVKIDERLHCKLLYYNIIR